MQPDDIFENPDPRPSKSKARQARRAEKTQKQTGNLGAPLTPKSPTQREYLNWLLHGDSGFALGPAGTGKTYLAARVAARKLLNKQIDRIVIARATTAPDRRHELGFKPGKQDDKLAPWMIPIIDGLRAEMTGTTFDKLKNEKRIEFAPFESMRGRTFHDAMLVIDEAQNLTLGDMKLALTRIGENCQVIVTGDLDQSDIPDSGLERVVRLARLYRVPMKITEFGEDDIVRSALTKAWVSAFLADDAKILDGLPAFIHNDRVKSLSAGA